MATYSETKTLTQNAALRAQVEVAIQEVAGYMIEGNGGVAMSVNQLTNATLAKRNPGQFIDWFIYFVALDSNVIADGASPTDAHVKAVIDAKRMEIWS